MNVYMCRLDTKRQNRYIVMRHNQLDITISMPVTHAIQLENNSQGILWMGCSAKRKKEMRCQLYQDLTKYHGACIMQIGLDQRPGSEYLYK